MRKLILVVALCFVTSYVFAGSGELVRDSSNKGTSIQGAAWNGSKALALTAYSTTVDFSNDIACKVFSTVNCYERWMPLSTSTKSSYVQTIILANTWEPTVINPLTPFGNFSGCTGGYIKRQ